MPTDCILHGGRLDRDGYGRVGRDALAHRVAWEAKNGPIPRGLTIDHLCYVRQCVNPDHMEIVTSRENTQRGKARQTHCIHGHEFTPENTYLWSRKPGWVGRLCRACNRRNAAKSKARRLETP